MRVDLRTNYEQQSEHESKNQHRDSTMTRIMALDIGEVRTGIALSDTGRNHASALQVLDTKVLCKEGKVLNGLIADYEVDTLLIGLPLLEDGSEGSQARRTRSLADKMLGALSKAGNVDALHILFYDERKSSKQAKEYAWALDLNEREMRGKLDSHAAANFLQNYLDKV